MRLSKRTPPALPALSPTGHGVYARYRVVAWAVAAAVGLLATLLTPLSGVGAQTVPAAATNVVATPGNQQVALSWIAGPDNGARVIWWEYTQSSPPTGVWIPIAGSGSDTNRHVVTGLNGGGPNGDGQSGYRFRVRAFSSAGYGAESAESNAAVPSTVPAAPVDLETTVGNSQVVLSWTAAGDNTAASGFSPIVRYEYRQKTGHGAYAPWAVMVDSGGDTAAHAVTGLANGTTYQFQIRALNANGAGPVGETEPVTVATTPGRPQSLRAVPGDRSARLFWTASGDGGSPITSWQFRKATGTANIADSVPWVTIPNSSAGTTSYTVVGLDNDNHVYRFEVRAANAVGPGAAAVTEAVDPGQVPARPTNVVAAFKDGTTDTITLRWQAPSGRGSPITGYQYSQKAGVSRYGPWQDIPDSGPQTATHEVSDLMAGTRYQFRVRAVNGVGGGIASTATKALYPGTVPDAPRELRVANSYNAAKGTRQVTLRWRPGHDGGSPVVKWEYKFTSTTEAQGLASFGDDEGWVTICDSTTRADASCRYRSSVTLPRTPAVLGRLRIISGSGGPELVPVAGETYQVVVRATNEHGTGHRSGVAATAIPRIVPTTPAAVYFRDADDDSFTVWWPASADGGANTNISGTNTRLRYQLSYRPDGGSWTAWRIEAANTATISGAVAGTRYWVRVRAENAVGFSEVAESRAYTHGGPPTPGADAVGTNPVLVAEAGDARVALSLARSAHAGNIGGITNATRWEYSFKVGDGDFGGWTFNNVGPWFNDVTVDSLANGEAHTFRIRGVNGLFAGPALESDEVIPGPAPYSPASLEAVGGDQHVVLTWMSRGDGPPITKWQVCEKTNVNPCGDVDTGDGWTDIVDSGPGTTSHTVEDLVNGAEYTFLVRAWNAKGHGARALVGPVAVGAAPDAPEQVRTEVASQQFTVTVTAPIDDHGSPVTSYEIRTRGAGGPYSPWETIDRFGTEETTTTTVAGLINGIGYDVEVRAINGFGPSDAVRLAAVTPVGPPPGGVLIAEPENAQAVLRWFSGGDGGSAITGWQYRMKTADGDYGDWISMEGGGPATAAHTVAGLKNGIAYTFQVRAVNEFGSGDPFESNPVTPGMAPPPPAAVIATAGNGQVTLEWVPGASGAPGEASYAAPATIWQYRQSTGGDHYSIWLVVEGGDGEATRITIGSLINGTPYLFEVRGINEMGPGAAGAARATPGTVPAAPEVSAERGDAMVTLLWTAGGDGGSAVAGWQVQVNGGQWMPISGSEAGTSSHTVTGLDNGTPYTFGVRAVNGLGEGAAGSASATPAATPAAPVVTATRGVGEVTVLWTAGDDGGSAVTGWQVQMNGGQWTDLSVDASSHTVGDLENGTLYTFGVRALNDVGEGAVGTVGATPATTPAAPVVTAVGGNGEIAVLWTAGSDGGSAVIAWQYRTKISIGDYGDWIELSADTMSVTLDGWGIGTGVLLYTFDVRAVNAVGEGAAGTSDEVVAVEAPSVGGAFYSGVVTGPDFCANRSLGGARLFAHDFDGDGVADVCSLPYTRREAIARQSAVEALTLQFASEYAALVNAACAVTAGDAACGGETLGALPAIPINDGGPYYSGVITGPNFCANLSLGGPTTYPHDDDKDGVAEVCALPYTRREAIARQLAGDVLAATVPADFRRELASACRALTRADYGDDPDDLARDACA